MVPKWAILLLKGINRLHTTNKLTPPSSALYHSSNAHMLNVGTLGGGLVSSLLLWSPICTKLWCTGAFNMFRISRNISDSLCIYLQLPKARLCYIYASLGHGHRKHCCWFPSGFPIWRTKRFRQGNSTKHAVSEMLWQSSSQTSSKLANCEQLSQCRLLTVAHFSCFQHISFEDRMFTCCHTVFFKWQVHFKIYIESRLFQ